MKQARRIFDVVTVGAATRDVFVRSSHFERMPSSSAPDGWDACLPMGAKIPVDDIVFETGGGATNAAVTFARLHLKTACIGRVGKDAGADEVRKKLKAERIDERGIQTDPERHTAYSIILLAGTGSRSILVHRGASNDIDPKRIPWTTLSSRWIYLTSLGGNRSALTGVFAHAKKTLTKVAWNPGGKEIALGRKRLLSSLMQTDVLILNREEAAALANTTPRDLAGIIRSLGALPRLALIVTDGKHGAYAHARGMTWYAPTPKVKAINTTGAGDAFGSGLVAALIKGDEISHALQNGTLNALGVITHMGAKAGILDTYPTTRQRNRIKIRHMR